MRLGALTLALFLAGCQGASLLVRYRTFDDEMDMGMLQAIRDQNKQYERILQSLLETMQPAQRSCSCVQRRN